MTRIIVSVALAVLVFQTLGAATVTFNGGVTYQTIEGFGANINHRSWTNNDLKPVYRGLGGIGVADTGPLTAFTPASCFLLCYALAASVTTYTAGQSAPTGQASGLVTIEERTQ